MSARSSGFVFIHPSDELYGADRMLLSFLAALPAGERAEVWLPTDLPHTPPTLCDELTRRGIAVQHRDLPILRRAYRSPRALLSLARRTLALTVALRRRRPAVVYCTTSAAFLGIPAARAARVPHVAAHVQEIWSGSDERMLGPLAGLAHQLLAVSAASRSSLPPRVRSRCVVVHNGSSPPAVSGGASSADDGPRTFLVASRWSPKKGLDTLLEAWRIAAPPTSRLVVLGGPPPVGEAVDVHTIVAQMAEPGSVEIVGQVPSIEPYLATADVVLMPSAEPEPFGLVATEAFARGIPVIAAATGGLLEIVDDGTSGWLFPPGDAAALGALLAGLDDDRVSAAGVRARRVWEDRFTEEAFARRWRAALRSAGVIGEQEDDGDT